MKSPQMGALFFFPNIQRRSFKIKTAAYTETNTKPDRGMRIKDDIVMKVKV